MKMRIVGTGVLAFGLLAGTVMAEHPAKEPGKKDRQEPRREKAEKPERAGKAGGEERQAFQAQQQERTRAHFKAQRESGQALMQSVMREEDAQKALGMIREHRQAQREKSKAFHDQQWEQQMQFTAGQREKQGVAPERRAEMLKKMTAAHASRQAEADSRYTALMGTLDALAAKPDLTKEDIRHALRDTHGKTRQDRPGVEKETRRREGKDGDGGAVEKPRERKPRSERPEADREKRVRQAKPDA